MKKLLTIVIALVMVCSAVFALVACDNSTANLEGTAKVVAEASKMSLEDLKAASKKEMEESNDTFKVVGLTSVLDKTLVAFSKEYDWIKYKDADGKVLADANAYCNNSYKDHTLLQALATSETKYFADFALVQDVRSIAAIDGEQLHNFVPSDYKELGYTDNDIQPLKGIYFNKLFWTNTNFTNVTSQELWNIWQLAGVEVTKDAKDKDQVTLKAGEPTGARGHIEKVSFQTATTELINMSFLVSCEAPENQKRIEDAYQSYYGKAWSSDTYASAGQQWVTEFVLNISNFHSSDGTAMKQTQIETDWEAGVVYYGAFAKMKDAVGKWYAPQGVDVNSDDILKELVETEGDNKGKVNAMKTVKWDWEIEGFNGFMYAMCSQVVNKAKHPYTACLYARYLCTLQAYEGSIYNNALPYNENGNPDKVKVNQFGYYSPATNSLTYAFGDWDRETHIKNELVEDYNYLKTAKLTQVSRISALIGSKPNKVGC